MAHCGTAGHLWSVLWASRGGNDRSREMMLPVMGTPIADYDNGQNGEEKSASWVRIKHRIVATISGQSLVA